MYGFAKLDEGKGDVDLEKGTGSTLYPGLSLGENELRWGFIRKVYGILAAQLLLTTAVASVTVLYTPIYEALSSSPGLVLGFGILPLFLYWVEGHQEFQIIFFPSHGVEHRL